MAMKKILVPIDFSQPSEWAIEAAISFAKKVKGEIVLLHIVEQATNESFSVQAQVSDAENWEDKLFTLKLIERNRSLLNHAVEKISDAVPVHF